METIYKWLSDEEDKVREEIIKSWKYHSALDAHREDFKPIHEEGKRRYQESYEKYGYPLSKK